MIVGGYSLHLYCDDPQHKARHPVRLTSLDGDFAGPTKTDCMKQARSRGWRFADEKCVCPSCSKQNIARAQKAGAL